MAECPECLYSPYVEGKPHAYGGRESAGLTCYGPKRRQAIVVNRPPPPKQPPIDPADPVMTAPVPLVEKKPERAAPALKPMAPKLTKAQKALEALARRFNLKPATAIPPPPPTADPGRTIPAPDSGSPGQRRTRAASSANRSDRKPVQGRARRRS